MSEPLLHFLTRWVVLILEALRGRHRRHIVPVIFDPARCTPEDIHLMMSELRSGEARLWREITEGAMRELGMALARQPLSAYARPAPRSWPELRNRLLVYQHMLRDPEACVRRLLARLRRSPPTIARATISLAARDVAAILPLVVAPRCATRAHPAIHPP